jgi:hypothetical protein
MRSYKEPTFQERSALAQQAREKALKKLAARPQMDEAEVARRKAAQDARDAAAAEKRALRKAEIEQAKAEQQAAADAATQAAAEIAARPVLTEAELKAGRDAKYAARKARKK